jgi:hypothetical protein
MNIYKKIAAWFRNEVHLIKLGKAQEMSHTSGRGMGVFK